MTAQTSPSFSADEFWIADSGASHHMTNNVTQLAQVAPYTADEKITVGNGEGLCIAHVGNASIPSISGSLRLNQVYHVPQLAASLLSIFQLCKDNKCWVIFDDSYIYAQDKATKVLLYKGRSNKGMYPIPQALGDLSVRSNPKSSPIIVEGIASTPTALLGKPVSSVLWHQRFGHVSNEVLTQMLKQSQISSVSDSSQSLCSFCLSGKMHRLPFASSQSHSSLPFQRLHSDVWGPSSSVAFGGYRYYASIIDDCIRFLWIFPLINKSEVFPTFVKFHAYITKHFQASVQYFQSMVVGSIIVKHLKISWLLREFSIRFHVLIPLSKMGLLRGRIGILLKPQLHYLLLLP
ncbi:hypothetical protein L3X38_026075 [Prunus dulcis]|uniref:GAG-pre-integrase domain-containing protein n=1 Tax=Prunus dulcis TaxID=3755 RepID=A0AAD4W5H6_PRUDU|nr:hypothetical protein L3X38_026075 [Prunus dulcis]